MGGQSETNSYTGDGLRQSRTVAGSTKTFIYDVGSTLPVLLDDGSQYIYGLGLISRIVGGTTHYYRTDGLGSVLAIVDASGYVEQSYAYDVFGAVTQQSGSLGSEPQFAGQQTDPTGLQYLRARFYDPATGRFLSRDSWSVADKTIFHPYSYARNNPVTATDPSGHCVGVGDLDPEDPNNADCPGMINGQMAETTASSNPTSGPTGTLIVIGGMLEDFSPGEVAAAQMFEGEGNTVILSKAPSDGRPTSDLLVDGVAYDVYTPQFGTPVRNILSEAASKYVQVGNGGDIVIDLVNTGLGPGDFGNALVRINGFIRSWGVDNVTISDVRFINSGQ